MDAFLEQEDGEWRVWMGDAPGTVASIIIGSGPTRVAAAESALLELNNTHATVVELGMAAGAADWAEKYTRKA